MRAIVASVGTNNNMHYNYELFPFGRRVVSRLSGTAKASLSSPKNYP